jgi:hypothetical protein
MQNELQLTSVHIHSNLDSQYGDILRVYPSFLTDTGDEYVVVQFGPTSTLRERLETRLGKMPFPNINELPAGFYLPESSAAQEPDPKHVISAFALFHREDRHIRDSRRPILFVLVALRLPRTIGAGAVLDAPCIVGFTRHELHYATEEIKALFEAALAHVHSCGYSTACLPVESTILGQSCCFTPPVYVGGGANPYAVAMVDTHASNGN